MLLADVGADIELNRDTNLYRKKIKFLKKYFSFKNLFIQNSKTPTFK